MVDHHQDICYTSVSSFTDWTRLYAPLPEGMHQIVIEGERAQTGSSGIAIDDLWIQPCADFSKCWTTFLVPFIHEIVLCEKKIDHVIPNFKGGD